MIEITFPAGIDSLTAKGLTQYDTGQRIEISGTGVTTETVQVHFAASGQSSAIIKPGTVVDSKITAEIPDSVLAMGRTVTAWAYVIDGDERETKYTVVLPVVSRVRPQDYISPAEPPYLTANELGDRIVTAETAVTELSDGLTARYTKTEADGLLAGKASKSAVPAETGLQTVVGKNQFYPVAQDNTGRIIGIYQYNVWNGSAWVTSASNGFGVFALQNNTGGDSNGVGHYALLNNTGSYSNGVGNYALRNNTGIQCNGVGYYTLGDNTGNYSNGFGHNALRNKTGDNSNGFGGNALRSNTGSNNSAFGDNANNSTDATINALSNTTCLGATTLPNKSNQVVLGNGSVDTVKMGGTARTPASSTATGVKGETCWDTNYFYVCVATNIWKRIKMEVW